MILDPWLTPHCAAFTCRHGACETQDSQYCRPLINKLNESTFPPLINQRGPISEWIPFFQEGSNQLTPGALNQESTFLVRHQCKFGAGQAWPKLLLFFFFSPAASATFRVHNCPANISSWLVQGEFPLADMKFEGDISGLIPSTGCRSPMTPRRWGPEERSFGADNSDFPIWLARTPQMYTVT